MHIYFLGSISALGQMASTYIKIIDTLEGEGHKIWCEHVINRKSGNKIDYPVKDDKDYYDAAVARIRFSDAIFAEITHCTPNVSYELAYALENSVPVVCFYRDDARIPTMLAGSTNPNLYMYPYSDKADNLSKHINRAQDIISNKLKLSLHVPITPQSGLYLDWLSKTKKISRSSIVRSFIEHKMTADTKYKKTLK